MIETEKPSVCGKQGTPPDRESTSLTGEVIASVAPSQEQPRKRGRSMRSRCQTGSVRCKGKVWYGRYRRDVPGRDSREQVSILLGRKPEMTKGEAKRKLQQVLDAEGINTSLHLERALKPADTFSRVAEQWTIKKLPTLSPSSQHIIPIRLKKYIIPCFGELDVNTIKSATINDWLRSLTAQGLQAKTCHNLYKDVRAICNWHRRQQDLEPVHWYAELPALSDDEPRWFTPSEMRRIIDAAVGVYKILFQLAAFTGMRASELAGLRVEDVDFTRGVIQVRRSLTCGVERLRTKSRAGRRTVFLDSVTLTMLQEFLGSRQTGRVFYGVRGGPMGMSEVSRRVLTPLCIRLGIIPGGLHSFRHGRVSHMQASGMPRDFMLSQVGHSSLNMLGHYTHFADEQKRNLAEQLLNCGQTGQLWSAVN